MQKQIVPPAKADHRFPKEALLESVGHKEQLRRAAAYGKESGERLQAVTRLGDDLESLIFIIIKSAHADSADAARKQYNEALDRRNTALVHKCVAIYLDKPQERMRAVESLRGNSDMLHEVEMLSNFEDARKRAAELRARGF